jgi:phosphodiesterase/alkaline phosphatase D-like protein
VFLLDIRSRRDKPALDPEMSEPGRSMLGDEQREWLFGALDDSTASWRLVGSPSVSWCEHPSELLQTAMVKPKLIDGDGQGPDEDQWDGTRRSETSCSRSSPRSMTSWS